MQVLLIMAFIAIHCAGSLFAFVRFILHPCVAILTRYLTAMNRDLKVFDRDMENALCALLPMAIHTIF
jgi:hypothetical protein